MGDITKASTLTPEKLKGVRKVINAVSVIVGPKEGDTPDRAKYSQVNNAYDQWGWIYFTIFLFYLCPYGYSILRHAISPCFA